MNRKVKILLKHDLRAFKLCTIWTFWTIMSHGNLSSDSIFQKGGANLSKCLTLLTTLSFQMSYFAFLFLKMLQCSVVGCQILNSYFHGIEKDPQLWRPLRMMDEKYLIWKLFPFLIKLFRGVAILLRYVTSSWEWYFPFSCLES